MNTNLLRDYLYQILADRLTPVAWDWLQKTTRQVSTDKEFYLAFSMAPRYTGKQPLVLTQTEIREAEAIRTGFNPSAWTADQASRTLLVLTIPHASPEDYSLILNKVFSTADLSELTTLYAALPVLPYPETHVKRAAEGVRTTMTQVFDAVALHNPYPHDYLPEEAWNQMVLKSVFNVRPLYQIYGLDHRRNQNLADMLVDYAHERWAAGRTLTPELWRLVGPFLKPEHRPDLEKLLTSSDNLQQQAAFLAIQESQLPEAKTWTDISPASLTNLQNNPFTWNTIGEQAYT